MGVVWSFQLYVSSGRSRIFNITFFRVSTTYVSRGYQASRWDNLIMIIMQLKSISNDARDSYTLYAIKLSSHWSRLDIHRSDNSRSRDLSECLWPVSSFRPIAIYSTTSAELKEEYSGNTIVKTGLFIYSVTLYTFNGVHDRCNEDWSLFKSWQAPIQDPRLLIFRTLDGNLRWLNLRVVWYLAKTQVVIDLPLSKEGNLMGNVSKHSRPFQSTNANK